jgi:peptide chain release factor 2
MDETGAHRIVHTVRGRRQTSLAVVECEPVYAHERMHVPERELRIERMRGSGPGGQHRNKVETMVRITHLPTGLQAQADTRSQADSLRLARQVLMSRIASQADSVPATGRSSEGSFGSQRRSYRLHGTSQGVVDHRTNQRAGVKDVLEDGRIELLQ